MNHAPSITFEHSDSYYAWFREAEGWVVDVKLREGITKTIPTDGVFVTKVDDDGLTVCEYENGFAHKEETSVFINYDEIDILVIL